MLGSPYQRGYCWLHPSGEWTTGNNFTSSLNWICLWIIFVLPIVHIKSAWAAHSTNSLSPSIPLSKEADLPQELKYSAQYQGGLTCQTCQQQERQGKRNGAESRHPWKMAGFCLEKIVFIYHISIPTVEEVTLMEEVTLTGRFSMVTFPDKVPVITVFQ